jgi:hypothetical protein
MALHELVGEEHQQGRENCTILSYSSLPSAVSFFFKSPPLLVFLTNGTREDEVTP